MMVRPWNFFDGISYQESEAHIILDNYLNQVLLFMEDHLGVNVADFNNINTLVDSQLFNKDPDVLYFWDWMDSKGIEMFRTILRSNLLQTDEFLDLLDHRLYVLELDMQSNIKDNIYHSIAESLNTISDCLDAKNQTSASKEQKISLGTIISDYNQLVLKNYYNEYVITRGNMMVDKYNTEFYWNSRNPAETQQDFCYYLGKE